MSTSAAATATAFDGTTFAVGSIVTVSCKDDPAEGIGEDDGDECSADAPAELFSEEWIRGLGPVEFI